jgi:hypothetical protein
MPARHTQLAWLTASLPPESPRGQPEPHPIRQPRIATPTMTTTLALLLALLLLPVLILLWATESTEQRARRLRRSYGWSQRRIADHMNISRYAVRRALA